MSHAHGGAVSIGNHSAILENGGTPERPVRMGQKWLRRSSRSGI
jgi:hypothetical protein